MGAANIKDLAQLACVSTSTVSRVLNNSGYVSVDARQRVLDAVQKLDYRPNMIARGLKSSTSRTIGLVVTDITNPFFAAIARETEELLSQHDYSLIICNTSERPDKELRHLQLLYERKVDGILLCATGKNNDYVRKLANSDIAVVLIDRDYDDLKMDIIKDDNVYGAQVLTEELINKGHRHIALIKGHPNSRASAEREQGYLAALNKRGIAADPNCIFTAGASGESTENIISSLLDRTPRPTAILSLNASIAKRIISTLNTRKVRIPQDIALASYGLEEFKTLFIPSITCVVQHPERYGEISAKILIERLENKKTEGSDSTRKIVLFSPELFKGDSI